MVINVHCVYIQKADTDYNRRTPLLMDEQVKHIFGLGFRVQFTPFLANMLSKETKKEELKRRMTGK